MKLVMLDRTKHLIDANDLKHLMDRPEFAGQSEVDIDLDDFIREARKLPVRDADNQIDMKFEITVRYEDVSRKSRIGQRDKKMTSDQARA